jgi:hypothetical protein
MKLTEFRKPRIDVLTTKQIDTILSQNDKLIKSPNGNNSYYREYLFKKDPTGTSWGWAYTLEISVKGKIRILFDDPKFAHSEEYHPHEVIFSGEFIDEKSFRQLIDSAIDVQQKHFSKLNLRKEIRRTLKEFYHPVVKYGDQEYANPFDDINDNNKRIDKLSEQDIEKAIGSKYIEIYRASFERFSKNKEAVYSISFYHNKLDKMMDKIVYIVKDDNGKIIARFK